MNAQAGRQMTTAQEHPAQRHLSTTCTCFATRKLRALAVVELLLSKNVPRRRQMRMQRTLPQPFEADGAMMKEKNARAQLVDSVLWIYRAVARGTLRAQTHSSCVSFASDVKREVDHAVLCRAVPFADEPAPSHALSSERKQLPAKNSLLCRFRKQMHSQTARTLYHQRGNAPSETTVQLRKAQRVPKVGSFRFKSYATQLRT
jgi:hypothetical protein